MKPIIIMYPCCKIQLKGTKSQFYWIHRHMFVLTCDCAFTHTHMYTHSSCWHLIAKTHKMVSKGALSMQHNHILCIIFIGLRLLSCTCTISKFVTDFGVVLQFIIKEENFYRCIFLESTNAV